MSKCISHHCSYRSLLGISSFFAAYNILFPVNSSTSIHQAYTGCFSIPSHNKSIKESKKIQPKSNPTENALFNAQSEVHGCVQNARRNINTLMNTRRRNEISASSSDSAPEPLSCTRAPAAHARFRAARCVFQRVGDDGGRCRGNLQ